MGEAVNAINVIAPYKHFSMWVFDDPNVGLRQEPFVGGADTSIDRMVASIPYAEDGFVMVFSGTEFPGYQQRLELVGPQGSGNRYRSRELAMDGWLCPALLRYFEEPPEELFVQVQAKQ